MKTKLVQQNPIILRCHRVMEAFAKSDDERDFYLDRFEGFLIFVDLDKSEEELSALMAELRENKDRYIPIPKMTFYEVKKLMESFVNEKVYDIDTKEKLLDIIQSREARENFLEFVYDHHSELEKWQQYYQERFRIRIIEWLRNHSLDFVFEEDIELTKSIVEKIKINMFSPSAPKDIAQARKLLAAKAATYYSNEALNPRPKRGRPPKQVVKVETEPQFSQDIYTAVPKAIKPFLFNPDYHSSSMIFTFSGKFASEADLLAHRRQQLQSNFDLQTLNQKLAALQTLSSNWRREHDVKKPSEEEVGEESEAAEEFNPKKRKTALLQKPQASKKIAEPASKLDQHHPKENKVLSKTSMKTSKIDAKAPQSKVQSKPSKIKEESASHSHNKSHPKPPPIRKKEFPQKGSTPKPMAKKKK